MDDFQAVLDARLRYVKSHMAGGSPKIVKIPKDMLDRMHAKLEREGMLLRDDIRNEGTMLFGMRVIPVGGDDILFE
jgi:hypothetical protein